MNEDQEIFNQEDILENTTSDEDVLSSDKNSSLEDKLDRLEALLNEEIANRENIQMETGYGSEYTMLNTSSGVNDPNYSQYIYDLLTDSTIKVEIVESQDITEKPLNNYSISEALDVILIVLILIMFLDHFIHDYVFKFKRR